MHLCRHDVCVADEDGRGQIGGIAVERARIGGRHDASLVQDGDLIGQAQRFVLIVGDEDGRGVRLCQNAGDVAAHTVAQRRVERAERLVEQDHFGMNRQSPGESDPLLLAP